VWIVFPPCDDANHGCPGVNRGRGVRYLDTGHVHGGFGIGFHRAVLRTASVAG
jgi:hypothetical protein